MTANFHGIFYTFYKNYRSSIKNIVKVEASTTISGRGDPYCTIDPDVAGTSNEDTWISEDKENSSIEYTFLKDKVSLTAYSFKSRGDWGENNPLEWNLYGSNDKKRWNIIHHKERNSYFDGLNKEKSFSFRKTIPYKHFKIMNLGTNSHSNYHFAFNLIEFFGVLNENFEIYTGQRPIKCMILSLLYLFIMIS